MSNKLSIVIIRFILVILCISLINCNTKKEIIDKPSRYKSPSSIYKRDSLYIAATIWQLVDKQFFPFDFISKFNIPLDLVRYDVDTIIYSPDSLKLFSFVIERVPRSEMAKDKISPYHYAEFGFAGFRDSIYQPWTIVIFDYYTTTGLKTYNDNRNNFRNFYFNRFRNHSEYVWDSIKHDFFLEYFKYNLNDTHFWDSSVVWRKGARIPGYYNFQTKGNVKPGDENAIIVMPHLDYPDSLLNMYSHH